MAQNSLHDDVNTATVSYAFYKSGMDNWRPTGPTTFKIKYFLETPVGSQLLQVRIYKVQIRQNISTPYGKMCTLAGN
jgi:hypothetical protein